MLVVETQAVDAVAAMDHQRTAGDLIFNINIIKLETMLLKIKIKINNVR